VPGRGRSNSGRGSSGSDLAAGPLHVVSPRHGRVGETGAGLPRPCRTSALDDAHSDARVIGAVKKTGRKKVVIAALWTEICLAMPAIQAAGEGFEVYAVTEHQDGVSVEAHEMGVRRMMMAGVVPINWLAVASEWQRDWARQDSAKSLGQSVLPHTGATGTSLDWRRRLTAVPQAQRRSATRNLRFVLQGRPKPQRDHVQGRGG
jgi:hypothetical protein